MSEGGDWVGSWAFLNGGVECSRHCGSPVGTMLNPCRWIPVVGSLSSDRRLSPGASVRGSGSGDDTLMGRTMTREPPED
jgi:hypothetical protein